MTANLAEAPPPADPDAEAYALLGPDALAKLVMDTHRAILAAKRIYYLDHAITLALRGANSQLRDALSVSLEILATEV